MTDGLFPETPKGDPAEIEAAAARLSDAADALETASTSLLQTASGLSGVAWSGMAEGRFTGASGGLGHVSRGTQETLHECAAAAREYGHELSKAQHVIEHARQEYDRGQAEQVAAGALVGQLTLSLAGAQPHEQADLEHEIRTAHTEANGAGDRAHAALQRAQRARQEFDQSARHAAGLLNGTAPTSSYGLGSPGESFVTPIGAGGFGALGGGFGVPLGGLSSYTGLVQMGDLEQLDPLANSAYQDATGQTEVPDLTLAVTTVVAPLARPLAEGAVGILGRVAATGRAAAPRLAGAVRGVWENPELRGKALEQLGEGMGKAGVPYAGDAGKIASYFARPEVREAWASRLSETQAWTRRQEAIIRASAELSRGVRKGVSPDVIEHLKETARVP